MNPPGAIVLVFWEPVDDFLDFDQKNLSALDMPTWPQAPIVAGLADPQ
jgi:hypothetical protein